MGVTGLWKLIEPCGKPVPVETLEGKILAVDISIWLHQVVKGFQDNKGSALNNAHLLGLFHRLCKLLYYRVRPVFIFDGCVPQLKRETIARRQQQRNKLSNEADRIQALLLQSLAKEKVVQQALGTNAELLLKSPVKRPTKPIRGEDAMDEIFKLPELPSAEGNKSQDCESDAMLCDKSYNSDDYSSTSATDSSYDESNARSAYNNNLQAIDVKSQYFRSLPADVRHDILTDIKETRKQSSWGRLHELPSQSDDFSTFQMKRLLKRRAVQESLEAAEQEMGGCSLTYSQLSNFFNEEGIITPSAITESTKQISSDENTRFLLVRDLKKKLAKTESEHSNYIKTIKEEEEEEVLPEEAQSVKNALLETKQTSKTHDEAHCKEYDADLELAIALSMEQTQVYNEQDYEYDADQNLKLNRKQSKQLRNAAKGPARAYMIEYGGMNDDEVNNIMDVTQPGDPNNLSYLDRLLDITATETNEMPQDDTKLTAPLQLVVSDDDDNEAINVKQSYQQSTMKAEKPRFTSKLKLPANDDEKPHCTSQLKLLKKFETNAAAQVSAICIAEPKLEAEKLNLHVSDASDTDSDFEEVTNEAPKQSTNVVNPKLQIVLNLKESLAPQDDLFADVFESEVHTEVKRKPQVLETAEIIVTKDSQEELLHTAAASATKLDVKSIGADKSNLTSTVNNAKMLSILDELKKQTADVKNIKLETIKINNPVIEIVEDAISNVTDPIETKIKTEIIEIYDSDDNQSKSTKSPKQQTPRKHKAITEYFDAAYHIKRTPDKPRELSPSPAKVKSPFFVNKTPKSGRKRTAHDDVDDASSDSQPTPAKKSSKVSKMLFENSPAESAAKPDFLESLPPAKVSTEELIQEAADALKSQKTAEELDDLAKQLAVERRDLEAERNRQDRMGMSISQRMNAECQELLRLFGVPFIVAPMEAEAQCAFLNAVELTNGTITDDSDIWLFGGRTVYKNFFAQNKHVLEFRAEQIEKSFNCDRKKLIQLACLVGSDYTTGVHGIGAVTALEILASFSLLGQDKPAKCDDREHSAKSIQSVISTLQKFRDWWLTHKNAVTPPGSSARLSLRKKLRNIELHEGFPSVAVIEAYMTPKIDDNKDAFSWGVPDVESLREFARKTFGWTTSKTDDILMPVMKKINEKKTQGSLLNYFAVKSALSVRQLQVSKRVQTAIDKMSGKLDTETPKKPAKSARTKRAAKRTSAPPAAATPMASIEQKVTEAESLEPTSTTVEKPDSIASAKRNRSERLLHATEEVVIPQRKINLARLAKNKEKAVEVFKKSAACVKKAKD